MRNDCRCLQTRRFAGTWDLKFEMNYDDTTIDLPAGFSVDYNGLSADVESVAISPIALSASPSTTRHMTS